MTQIYAVPEMLTATLGLAVFLIGGYGTAIAYCLHRALPCIGFLC